MTTKRNPKIEQYKNLDVFLMKLYGRSNQSQRTAKRGKIGATVWGYISPLLKFYKSEQS